MPIKIQDGFPAIKVLREENIFIITESRASQQDIRPLKILVLNLMPRKIITENQILRMLSNTPLQCEVHFIRPKSHRCRNTPQEHLDVFYKVFEEISYCKFDGLIITGAPVENLDFEEVDYWQEMVQILDWSLSHVYSTLFICWASQAALYHKYRIPKYKTGEKVSGIFTHRVMDPLVPLVRGFDDVFYAPHSRHTEIRRADISFVKDLSIIAESEDAGIYIVMKEDGREIYVTGHSEYDQNTIKEEYVRDLYNGSNPPMPKNYFPNNDTANRPSVLWRSHAHLLFSNWLNFYVYQSTPYDLERI